VRQLVRIAGGVLAGCLVAGCSFLPGLNRAAEGGPATPAATATPKPSASAPALAAESVLEDYIKRNNAANAALSDKLLAAYEGGSSLAIDKAAYLSQRKLGKDRDEYTPFSYVKPTFVAPATKRWFLATVYWKGKSETAEDPTFLVFVRDRDAWRQVYAPDLFEDLTAEDVPKLQVDATGAAVEVDQADATGLLMSPAAFARNYANHLMGKGSTATKSRFAADVLTTNAASNRIKMKRFARLTEDVNPAKEYPSYALRTADGGALVFTTLQRTKLYDVIQGAGNYVFQKDNGLLPGKYYTYLKVGELLQVAAYIPPKTAEPAQARVIGSYVGIVAGRGR
jgi:outer membrane murein-binding lipoprotein Lpp